MNRVQEKNDEQAFQAKEALSSQGRRFTARGRMRATSRGCGTGRLRGRGWTNEARRCYNCNKIWHLTRDCRVEPNQVDYAEEEEEEEEVDPANFLFMTLSECNGNEESSWFIDSGCSNHMTGRRELFRELDETHKKKIRLGNNRRIQVEGKGMIVVQNSQGEMKFINNVLFAPELAHNLLSVGQLMKSGYSLTFDDLKCVIKEKKTNQILVIVPMTNNLVFPLQLGDVAECNAALTTPSYIWHQRYGHLNFQALKLLHQEQMVLGLPRVTEYSGVCEGCILGKQRRTPFPKKSDTRAIEPLQLVHADLCGPMHTPSMGGSRFFFLLIDDYTRFNWVYLLKSKSEAFNAFKKFCTRVEKESGYNLKTFRTDRGGEFILTHFTLYCEENGIKHELTAPYTPEQNGVAERKNRTIVEMARSLLKSKELPNEFWAEGVMTAVYLLNLSPTKAVLHQSPF